MAQIKPGTFPLKVDSTTHHRLRFPEKRWCLRVDSSITHMTKPLRGPLQLSRQLFAIRIELIYFKKGFSPVPAHFCPLTFALWHVN